MTSEPNSGPATSYHAEALILSLTPKGPLHLRAARAGLTGGQDSEGIVEWCQQASRRL
jgi:hypothetical protein